MRLFIATVFSPAGEESLIKLKSETEESIRNYLRQQGFTIKKIQEEESLSLWNRLQGIELGVRIKPENRIRLLRTLGKMINRGYQLEQVFDFLLADEKEKELIRLLRILQRKTLKGYRDFVELFREAEEYFDEEFFSILIAGQKTGCVGQNLIDYAEGKDKMLQQKGALMRVLSGKFVMLAVVLVAFVVIVTFVVPQFMKLFGEKLILPAAMQIMVWVSYVFSNYGFLALVVSTGILLLILGFYKFQISFRFFIQDILLKTPVLGELLRMIHTRDFLYMMGNLVSKGVPLMQSIRIVIEQTGNLCFRSVYEALEKNLEKGRRLESLFREVPQGYLMDSVAQAITLGAKGGNLGEMLNEAYLTYDIQLQNRMGAGIKIIGGAVSIFTYLLIIFMIGSLALTLFKVMEDPGMIAFSGHFFL